MAAAAAATTDVNGSGGQQTAAKSKEQTPRPPLRRPPFALARRATAPARALTRAYARAYSYARTCAAYARAPPKRQRAAAPTGARTRLRAGTHVLRAVDEEPLAVEDLEQGRQRLLGPQPPHQRLVPVPRQRPDRVFCACAPPTQTFVPSSRRPLRQRPPRLGCRHFAAAPRPA